MKEKIEIYENIKNIKNNKFNRFVEFVDNLNDSKVNIKFAINTFIEFELQDKKEQGKKAL